MYADILVEVGSIDKTFTYKVPCGTKALVGERALVPQGTLYVKVLSIEPTSTKISAYILSPLISF